MYNTVKKETHKEEPLLETGLGIHKSFPIITKQGFHLKPEYSLGK